MANLKFRKVTSFILLLIVAALMIAHDAGMGVSSEIEITSLSLDQDEYKPEEILTLDVEFTSHEQREFLDLNFDFFFIDSTGYSNSYSSKDNEYISTYFSTHWTKDDIIQKDSISYSTQAKFTIATDFCNGEFKINIGRYYHSNSRSIYFKTIGQAQDCDEIFTEKVVIPKAETYTARLGGHTNTSLNSFLELDSGITFPKSSALQRYSGVDIVYTFSDIDSTPVIMSPLYASRQNNLELYQNWNRPPSTLFHSVDINPDSIQTSQEIASLFDLDSAYNQEGKARLLLNEAVLVKSDLNNYFLVQLKSASVGSSGFAEFKITH